jgi:hypothetical protein
MSGKKSKRVLPGEKMYLRARIQWADSLKYETDLRLFKNIALSSVRTTFGEVGSGIGEIEVV